MWPSIQDEPKILQSLREHKPCYCGYLWEHKPCYCGNGTGLVVITSSCQKHDYQIEIQIMNQRDLIFESSINFYELDDTLPIKYDIFK